MFDVSEVVMTQASRAERETGLMAWVAVTLDQRLRLDGLTLRRTRDGRLVISFPARRDRFGGQHPYVRPLNDATRRQLEEQILRALPDARAS